MAADGSTLASEEILNMCRRLMGGVWSRPSSPVNVQPISEGQTNQLFILQLKQEHTNPHLSPSSTLPHTAILRLFADIFTQDEIVTQNILYTILSERGIAPKLYGILPHSQGRIEHFYQCRTLHNRELFQPEVLKHTCRIVADIHRQEMPVPKDATFIFGCMRRWLKQCESVRLSDAGRQQLLDGMLSERKWGEELDWLEQHLKHLNHPIVFCHNDLSQANLLLLTDRQELTVKSIDFEFSNYNYRGFDFAQFFRESAFDYTVTQHPFYQYSESAYPAHATRCKVISLYLDYLIPDIEHSSEEIEKIVQEIEDMKILIDIWGVFWSLSMLHTSGTFGYLEFSQTRLLMYKEDKEKFIK